MLSSPYTLKDFDFTLDPSLIAQQPILPRHQAKMLAYQQRHCRDYYIKDLVDLLPDNSVLVVNNTKVLPALLSARKRHDNGTLGAHLKVNLHQLLSANGYEWHCFIKGSKKIQVNNILQFEKGLQATIYEKFDDGSALLRFNCKGDEFFQHIHTIGYMPLPPYIKREHFNNADDITHYQSIFAQEQGAVASPTASLHFTEDLMKALRKKNIIIEQITLHVGGGTFLPIKTNDINNHKMHKEYAHIQADVAERLNSYKQQKRHILVVGTTCLRTLETAVNQQGYIQAFQGETDIFIKPPYVFKFVDHLLTNFHLPKSTLFMLICAFIGVEEAFAVYQHAMDKRYRFFSYGDACLLHRPLSVIS